MKNITLTTEMIAAINSELARRGSDRTVYSADDGPRLHIRGVGYLSLETINNVTVRRKRDITEDQAVQEIAQEVMWTCPASGGARERDGYYLRGL